MANLSDFKIVLRPNNQVTVLCQNVIKRQKTVDMNISTERIGKQTINRYVRRVASENNLDTLYSKALKHEYLDKPKNFRIVPLDLNQRFQQLNGEPNHIKLGYGKSPKIKYFSSRSGQKLRESGAVIDILCDGELNRCRVVTLTIPSSDVKAYHAISDYSGYVINRLFQVVRRDYPSCHWFYVYEHQKRGALHLHICIYHPCAITACQIGDKILCKWREVLQDITKLSGVNMLYSKGFGRDCRLQDMQSINQPMFVGCGAYFSKYACKNSGKHADDMNSQNARKYPPSSFWGRDRALTKLCEQNSFHFKYEGVYSDDSEGLQKEAFELLSHMEIIRIEPFSFKKEIQIDRTDRDSMLTICEGEGTTFYLSPESYQVFLSLCRSHYERYNYINTLDKRRKNMQSATF